MLEKPDLQDEAIVACLRAEYGLSVDRLAFLPLGADQNTAVYRAVAGDGTARFVKLRRGDFDEIAVALPSYLSEQGIAPVLAPLPTAGGRLWAGLDGFRLILYPFVAGRSGLEADLSDRQWVDLGRALKQIHTTVLPAALAGRIPSETYAPCWRDRVIELQARVEADRFEEPVAAKAAAHLAARREEIRDLVAQAERLALAVQARALPFILCHSDIHEGNVLIGAGGELTIVDWDNPILAPKERDLMFIGGGICGIWNKPEQEALFYRGYGPAEIDPIALAYYRHERIVQDIAVECEQLLLTSAGGEDREQSYRFLASNFTPGGVLEIARRSAGAGSG